MRKGSLGCPLEFLDECYHRALVSGHDCLGQRIVHQIHVVLQLDEGGDSNLQKFELLQYLDGCTNLLESRDHLMDPLGAQLFSGVSQGHESQPRVLVSVEGCEYHPHLLQ